MRNAVIKQPGCIPIRWIKEYAKASLGEKEIMDMVNDYEYEYAHSQATSNALEIAKQIWEDSNNDASN
jgi:hypothetical protein